MKKENESSTPFEVKSSPSPVVLKNPLGSDTILAYLQKVGLPVTRENYLAINYPGGLPEPWTQDLENELPLELQQPISHKQSAAQEPSPAQ